MEIKFKQIEIKIVETEFGDLFYDNIIATINAIPYQLFNTNNCDDFKNDVQRINPIFASPQSESILKWLYDLYAINTIDCGQKNKGFTYYRAEKFNEIYNELTEHERILNKLTE